MENTEEFINYLPMEPPEGLLPWLRLQGMLNDEYIVYRAARGTDPLSGEEQKLVRCKCTACKSEFTLPRVPAEDGCYPDFGYIENADTRDGKTKTVKNNTRTKCPSCGENVTAKHLSGISKYGSVFNNAFAMSVHAIKGRLCLLGWTFHKKLTKEAETAITAYPYEGYAVLDKRIQRFCGYEKRFYNYDFLGHWEQRKQFRDAWGETQGKTMVFPWDPKLLEETSAANCKLDLYIKSAENTYPVTYMALWLRCGNVENLVMQGFGGILNEMIHKARSNYGDMAPRISQITGFYRKEAKPHKMLGISKEAARAAKRDKWSLDELRFYKTCAKHGIRPEEVKYYARAKEYTDYDVTRLEKCGGSVKRDLDYLIRQRSKYKNTLGKGVTALIDYLNMAEKLGEDISDRSVRYPQNLRKAHDEAAKRAEWKENAELVKKFEERYEHLKKYSYSENGLFIRPAHTQRELTAEGAALRHCVGGYAKRHAAGETNIFFIRHTETPDESYFTLELDEENRYVRQNRGMCNRARTEDVIKFEKDWLEYVKSIRKDDKNGRERIKCRA